MSASLARLLDCEKYLLAEMVYFHLPVEYARRDYGAEPLALTDLIDLIPWCESGSLNPKGEDGTDIASLRRTHVRLRKLYDEHAALHDLRLTGYVNDNFGALATTLAPYKTGLVCMAFHDDEGNGIVVYSGCETHRMLSMVQDYLGCFVAALGIDTTQHRRALAFYDAQTAGLSGERGVIGHSKGGNLATYVFINRLEQNLSVYCINAQPYKWGRMNAKQRAALKSGRYEFIAHEGDVVYQTGFVPYISRIVQVNPFLSRRQIVSVHGFCNMQYDGLGNLEGNRILRETRRERKSRLFEDTPGEVSLTREAVIAHFETLMTWDMQPARLLNIALEEVCLATQADTAVLMLRVFGEASDALYAYQARGEGAQRLRDFRMQIEKHDALMQVVSSGYPVYVSDPERYEQHFLPMSNLLGWRVASACVVPIGEEGVPWMGMLELLRKDDQMTVEDFELGVALAALIGRLRQRILRAGGKSLMPLMQFSRMGETLLNMERFAYRELTYRFEREHEALARLFNDGRLANDECLVFDGWEIHPEDRTLLKNWRRRAVAFIGAGDDQLDRALLKERMRPDVSPEEAMAQMGFHGRSLAWLQNKARAVNVGDRGAAEALRARVALCLLRRPPLIVCDLTGFDPEKMGEFRAYLKLLCYDRIATVLVIRRAGG